MKGYLEYLELYGYFARTGEHRISQKDYEAADAEWKELGARVKDLTPVEKARLGGLEGAPVPGPAVIDVHSRRVSASRVEMTELVLPGFTNALGTIFGGKVMEWIDIAGSIAAMRHAGGSVVTASIDSLQFLTPIHMGEVATLRASVNWVGRTSMEVGVRVDAENLNTGEKRYTTKAYLTFVAIAEGGKPRVVPKLELENDEDRRRHAGAEARRQARLGARK